jgi:DnaJ-domain-containing protein 1
MSGGFTMASAADLLKNLMGQWEEALQVTIETGYWKDTVACDRVVTEYGNQIAEALQSDKFSGDSRKALDGWLNLTKMEGDYRRDQMDFVRARVAAPDPNLWWMVLECHPKAPPDDVKKAFRDKMKSCHPDRVAGMAPEIRKLANDMAQKLTNAMRDDESS